MAPRGLVKARDYDYSNVGKQGRRTGITLKEGRRDEHGMEELDGMFSSPEKSPVGFAGNDTMMGSEGMSMDEGNGPGPVDFLSRSAARRSPFFPPPVARSPRKSGLSGSPRRTPGMRSSPMVQNDFVPSSPTSARQRRSRINETTTDTTTQSGRQPLNDRRPNTAPIATGPRQKGREFDRHTGEFANDENQPVLEDEDEDEDEDEEQVVNDLGAFETADLAGEDVDVDVHDIGGDDFEDESDNATPNEDENDNAENDDQSEEEEASPIHAAQVRNTQKNNRPTSAASTDADIQSPPKRKRGGRPPKSQSSKEDAEQRPAKKAKTSRPERARQEQPTEPLDPELEKVVENHVKRTGPLKGRSLYILKREEPSSEGAAHTRSGRVSVRPLAYWRNERCVYGDAEADVGQRYPLSTIKEIIRTEELQPEKTGGKKRKSKKSKARGKNDAESDDDVDEQDPWEVEEGELHGFVKKWDSNKQAASSEEEVIKIAFAPAGIEPREVKDSTFKVAKLFSESFIGSGVVELPPKGVKRPKNSKRMHMVFYVCHGRVQVDISGVQFTAGKGCVFQVPRGNFYSFANTYPKGARLFFTQAFTPIDDDEENPSSKAAATDDAENENETEDPADSEAAPAKKPKGRGRGRAKK